MIEYLALSVGGGEDAEGGGEEGEGARHGLQADQRRELHGQPQEPASERYDQAGGRRRRRIHVGAASVSLDLSSSGHHGLYSLLARLRPC